MTPPASLRYAPTRSVGARRRPASLVPTPVSLVPTLRVGTLSADRSHAERGSVRRPASLAFPLLDEEGAKGWSPPLAASPLTQLMEKDNAQVWSRDPACVLMPLFFYLENA